MKQTKFRVLGQISFWVATWIFSFKLPYLVWVSPDLDIAIVGFLTIASLAGLGLHEFIFSQSIARSTRSLWKSVLFWTLFWNVIVPIAIGLLWWVSARECICGGEAWICLCPPKNPLLAIVWAFAFLYLGIPGFLLIAPIGGAVWGLLFRRLSH